MGLGLRRKHNGYAIHIRCYRAQPATAVGTGNNTVARAGGFHHPCGLAGTPDNGVASDQLVDGGADMAAKGFVSGAEVRWQHIRLFTVAGDDDAFLFSTQVALCDGGGSARQRGLMLFMLDATLLLNGKTTICHRLS